ncbi:hypothetical protein R5M74_02385 [Aeromonas hydrophila]|nr:hypothetical protein R5M74_02385 [Aeromonas hydrophila]
MAGYDGAIIHLMEAPWRIPRDPQCRAGLYLKRWTPQEIKDELGLNSCRIIIYYWAEKLGWRDLLTEEAVEDAIARRVQSLLGREKKTSAELDELDRLIGHHVSLKEKAIKWAERQQALAGARA